MGHATLKMLSLVGAGTIGFLSFFLLEAALPGKQALFRFQLSSMIAMGVFAGLAIVIYVRLSRRWAGGRSSQRLRK
jgi:hypothetical protein